MVKLVSKGFAWDVALVGALVVVGIGWSRAEGVLGQGAVEGATVYGPGEYWTEERKLELWARLLADGTVGRSNFLDGGEAISDAMDAFDSIELAEALARERLFPGKQ